MSIEGNASVDSLEPLLLTPLHAARVLGIGRTTLYGLLRSGDLASVSIRGCRRIRYEALRAFVDRLEAGSTVEEDTWPSQPRVTMAAKAYRSSEMDLVDFEALRLPLDRETPPAEVAGQRRADQR